MKKNLGLIILSVVFFLTSCDEDIKSTTATKNGVVASVIPGTETQYPSLKLEGDTATYGSCSCTDKDERIGKLFESSKPGDSVSLGYSRYFDSKTNKERFDIGLRVHNFTNFTQNKTAK